MMRAFVAVALLLAMAACPPPPPGMSCSPTGGAGAASGSDHGYQVAGAPLAVKLFLGMRCDQSVEVKATVSVQDPNNQVLPLLEGQATRVVADSTSVNGMSTLVKVQAMLPGSYHFTARFEPNLGLVQTDVTVAENLSDAGAEITIPSASATAELKQCRHLDVTEGGKLLCLAPNLRVFSRDGAILQNESIASGARYGPVLWGLSDMGEVTRWVETDAGFVQDPPDAGISPAYGSRYFLAPGPDDVLITSDQAELRRVFLLDGGLTYEDISPSTTSSVLALWRDGDQFMTFGNGNEDRCAGRLHDAGAVCTHVTALSPPVPFGSDPSGIWTFAAGGGVSCFGCPADTVTLVKPTLTRDLVLPGGWKSADPADPVVWDTGAVLKSSLNGDPLVLTERGASFVLQKYPDGQLISVTSRYVTVLTLSGTVLMFRR